MRTHKRRRIENKTDYKLRLNLLKSGMPRIVIRKTNKYFIVQVVESEEAQDRVVLGVSSKDLLKNGWDEKMKGSLKSLPAGYLTGLLFAKKVKKGEYIVDLGMARTLSGSRIMAVIKGLVEGGLNVRANEKVFPSDERVSGESISENMKKNVEKVKSNLEKL